MLNDKTAHSAKTRFKLIILLISCTIIVPMRIKTNNKNNIIILTFSQYPILFISSSYNNNIISI